ncbi:ribosome-associated GTPase EngA [Plasmodium fragile]|uniref:GTPase Der n=1 Tax=Plasmodium fragile TaxID=5857 RepID=A0A0D9QK92_PLAFR|nr:ribosome-associated GTPase EngA [Plasmodium fragile]KJP87207.1 ribosome-associated GTPase EngA [Plasmodium fragile]
MIKIVHHLDVSNLFFQNKVQKKKNLCPLSYSSHVPFLNEHNKLKKNVYRFKIFVKEGNLRNNCSAKNGQPTHKGTNIDDQTDKQVRGTQENDFAKETRIEEVDNEHGSADHDEHEQRKKGHQKDVHFVSDTAQDWERHIGKIAAREEQTKGAFCEQGEDYASQMRIEEEAQKGEENEGEEGEESAQAHTEETRDLSIEQLREPHQERKGKKKDVDLKIIRNLPLVSIIGRPNVGKSTIFNRLTRKFQEGSIVLGESTTRDKIYGEVDWDGYKFEVVDTGGLIFEDEKFSKQIRDQILLALRESSVVLLVVDGINGVHPMDLEICRFLRKYIKNEYISKMATRKKRAGQVNHDEVGKLSPEDTPKGSSTSEDESEVSALNKSETDTTSRSSHNGADMMNAERGEEANEEEVEEEHENEGLKKAMLKVIVCVNKCESYKDGNVKAQNFWELGFGTPYPCSGIHGNGLTEILDECIKYIEKVEINEMEEEQNEENTINISFIGKPNTGKSSILNKILNCNRFIVSPIAGTTVDSIDVLVKIKDSDRIYRLIDTAGIQKRKKNVPFNEKTKYEYLLFNRTEKAIKRSDVCILVIDSFNGISSHDINIARKIVKENKSCIICCNKWDLIYNKNDIFNDTKNYVLNLLKPVDFANILFISAKTSQRLLNIFDNAEETYKQYTRKINTNSLNDVIKEALLLRPPIPIRNKSLNIYYAFQAHIKPPGFVFFCNSQKCAYENYTKYLESRIRDSFNIRGTPIRIYYKQKKKRYLIKKVKNPDKYNLDIEAIQKDFLKTQASQKSQG